MLSTGRFLSPLNKIFHHSYRHIVNCKFHKFETIVREREIASIAVHDPVMGIIEEMKQFVHEFNNHDNMEDFFTRKSQQNVLSVVQCSLDNNEYLYFRGRNIEVSLPSGSLCAERSAIANATSNNLSLHRKHFKRIAVIDPDFNIIGLQPCGVCKEYLQKFQEESLELSVITFPDADFKSIYEYFPANYPVQYVDAEETQKALDEQWMCSRCDAMNSGYSTDCYLCGSSKNGDATKRYWNQLFKDRNLILKVVNAIHDNFYPNKPFTYFDIININGTEDNDPVRFRIVVNSILYHWASSRRKILLRSREKKQDYFSTNTDLFLQYKASLTKHIANE